MILLEYTRRTPWLRVLLALAVLQLSGCTVGPKYQRPAAEVPATYKEVGDWKLAQPNEQNLPGNWWEIFQDPQLNLEPPGCECRLQWNYVQRLSNSFRIVLSARRLGTRAPHR